MIPINIFHTNILDNFQRRLVKGKASDSYEEAIFQNTYVYIIKIFCYKMAIYFFLSLSLSFQTWDQCLGTCIIMDTYYAHGLDLLTPVMRTLSCSPPNPSGKANPIWYRCQHRPVVSVQSLGLDPVFSTRSGYTKELWRGSGTYIIRGRGQWAVADPMWDGQRPSTPLPLTDFGQLM